MRQYISLALALTASVAISAAQITVHSTPSKDITITEPSKAYQPTRNLDFDNIEHMVGQTLFYRGTSNKKLYLQFFTKSILNPHDSANYVYKKDKQGNTPQEEMLGRYFLVKRIYVKRSDMPVKAYDRYCLELEDKASKELVYHYFWGNINNAFITQSYYDYLKSEHVGVEMTSLGGTVQLLDTAEKIGIERGSRWTCTDVAMQLDSSEGIYLVLRSEEGKVIKAYLEGNNQPFNFATPKYMGELQRRFGKQYAEFIIEHKVTTGMNAQMVEVSLGQSARKRSFEREGKIYETWEYKDQTISFVDKKVTQVYVHRRRGL